MTTQSEFYKEFLENRDNFDPRDFDVHLERGVFVRMVEEAFRKVFIGGFTFDEFLLHPRTAARFCEDFRYDRGWLDVPDDIILRALRMASR